MSHPKVFRNGADKEMCLNKDKIMTKKTNNATNPLNTANKKQKITQSSLLKNDNSQDTTASLEALKAMIFNANTVSQTKIQFIKEALEAGRYEIHNDHIAAKLLEVIPEKEPLEFA